ncbi:MAG: flagellar biosynthetic protein FliR [Cellulomonas sp. 73-92]|uniref:flagellar biosynthetic protein FliR n=1 Tax=Cellulomonas sp. 73-92 TaxID=1895740 RepID=UPI000927E30C|nr:flagellar biosynthetic protein FliR [Cellulomonas sp. 73-92]OJV81259.1 MAG: flagellar biosynthetic protein FliR [Cellulomonas sp. 73-92]
MSVTLPLGAVATTMLAGVRIAAFLLLAPPFSHKAVPGQVKALLAVGLALAVQPRLGAAAPTGTAAFVLDLVLQAVVGAALGFLVALVFAAVESAGGLVDLFGGFQMATAFDPLSLTNGATFSRLYQWLALALLVVSGGHQVVLAGLVRSFDVLPLGTAPDAAALAHTATQGLTGMVVAALQIAGPLLVVLFLADVGLGLLTRVAPALNAFAMGFPLKVLLTISLGGMAVLTLPGVVSGLVRDATHAMQAVMP